jgi:hypothetical protein
VIRVYDGVGNVIASAAIVAAMHSGVASLSCQ